MHLLVLVHLPLLPSVETGQPDLQADLGYGGRVLHWAQAADHLLAIHDPRQRDLSEHGMGVLTAGVPFRTAGTHVNVGIDDLDGWDPTTVAVIAGLGPADHVRVGGWHRQQCVPAVADRIAGACEAAVTVVDELMLPTGRRCAVRAGTRPGGTVEHAGRLVPAGRRRPHGNVSRRRATRLLVFLGAWVTVVAMT